MADASAEASSSNPVPPTEVPAEEASAVIAAGTDIENTNNNTDEEEDSTFGDGVESYTTSLASSITEYQHKHGRRYHAYQSGRYFLPNDEQEQDRLDIQYHALRLAFGDKPFFAPVDDSATAILDVGTGTGIWALDVADVYPSPVITGTDLSPIQPHWVPPNVKFEVDDAEQQWTWPPNHFDLVHTRIMNGSLRDWPKFFDQAFKHCKPSGWVEAQELSVDAKSDDSSLPADSYIRKWCQNQEDAAQTVGMSLLMSGNFLKQQMAAAGFVNISVREFKIPIGSWPADAKLKETGNFQLVAMLEGIGGLTVAFWVNCLGWSVEEVEVMLAKVKQEWKNTKIHSYWPLYAVSGQKPADTSSSKE